MEKLENNINHLEERDDEEETGIKYGDLLDQARKLIDDKNMKLAQYYVSLAILEPKIDLINKIKSIGILTFVRYNYKDSQIMDYLIYKIKKYLGSNEIKNFDFSINFCIIRVLYRGGLVKINYGENLITIHLLKEALNIFDEGEISNEKNSKDTISSLFRETIDKYKEEVIIVLYSVKIFNKLFICLHFLF